MATLKKEIRKKQDHLSKRTLRRISNPALKDANEEAMRERMVKAVLESEEDIKHGRVITHEELKKEIEKWRKKVKIEKKKKL